MDRGRPPGSQRTAIDRRAFPPKRAMLGFVAARAIPRATDETPRAQAFRPAGRGWRALLTIEYFDLIDSKYLLYDLFESADALLHVE